MDNLLIVVVGPTAVGKTAISIKLAENYNTEIVSADARQCYREMTIGTAKPSPEELATVKHHFVDTYTIHKELSAGKFELEALETIRLIHEKGPYCVMTGGSGLYVQAVCDGFDPMPKVDPQVRQQLNQQYAEHGLTSLLEKLRAIDPIYYEQVDKENPQRVIRGLEVHLATGKAYSEYRAGDKVQRPFSTVKIGLHMERELLYQRIEKRVDRMIEEGLFEEARPLYPFRTLNALQTVGYKELFGYFEGSYDRDEAIRLLKRNTRRYAKRQLTWFRKDTDVVWFQPEEGDQIIAFVNELAS